MDETFLKNLISNTEDAQGLEMAEAIRLLQSGDQAKLTQYLEDAQQNIKNEVTRSKTDMFQKVYGDMERASSTERAILYYLLRNRDVDNLQVQLYNRMKGQADSVILDKDLAKRQYEINQWTSGDKLDTLFVYQWIFMVSCVGILLMYLAQVGFIGSVLAWYIFIILIIIVVLITINRFQYTSSLRDQREWNRRRFPRYKPLPAPVCGADSLQSLSDSYEELKKSSRNYADNAGKAFVNTIERIGDVGRAAYNEINK